MDAPTNDGPRRRPDATFCGLLAAIALGALIFRIAYAYGMRNHTVSPDGWAYHVTALLVRDGLGFVNPLSRTPSASHPPLWTLVLTIPPLLGRDSILSGQVLAALIGVATVVVIGIAGRRIGSNRTGLIAALLAAAYPGFWVYEQRLLSEVLLFFGIAVLIVATYRYQEEQTRWRAVGLGALCGLLALTRSEQVLLVPLLLVPATLGWHWRRIGRRQIELMAFACVTTALVIAPWTLYNLSRLDEPVLLSNSFGSALAQGNCDSVYSGSRIGYSDLNCLKLTAQAAARRGAAEPLSEAALRREAISYMGDRLDRLPIVSVARQARAWSLFKPFETLETQAQFPQDPVWPQRVTIFFYWALIPAAVVGGNLLRRRGISLLPLVAPFVVAVVSIATTYGEPRLRAGAEVPLVLLAAVGVEQLASARERLGGRISSHEALTREKSMGT